MPQHCTAKMFKCKKKHDTVRNALLCSVLTHQRSVHHHWYYSATTP